MMQGKYTFFLAANGLIFFGDEKKTGEINIYEEIPSGTANIELHTQKNKSMKCNFTKCLVNDDNNNSHGYKHCPCYFF